MFYGFIDNGEKYIKLKINKESAVEAWNKLREASELIENKYEDYADSIECIHLRDEKGIFICDWDQDVDSILKEYDQIHGLISVVKDEGIAFTYDSEKMFDFVNVSKDAFLTSYSYLSEDDYIETVKDVLENADLRQTKIVNLNNNKYIIKLEKINNKEKEFIKNHVYKVVDLLGEKKPSLVCIKQKQGEEPMLSVDGEHNQKNLEFSTKENEINVQSELINCIVEMSTNEILGKKLQSGEFYKNTGISNTVKANCLKEDESYYIDTKINPQWTIYDQTVASSHLNNYGIIFCDKEYGTPIDDEYELETIVRAEIPDYFEEDEENQEDESWCIE